MMPNLSMKINIDFIDSLCFVLSQNNFDKDFFIIYDKKLKKIGPYIPADEGEQESFIFQAISINLRDKNKHCIIHSSEFPRELFDKTEFVYQVIRKATHQSMEENVEENEVFLNLNKFFEILKQKLKLNKNQMSELYEAAKYYDEDGILTFNRYATILENYDIEFDDEFLEFQEDIFDATKHLKADNEFNLAMVENIKENKNLIEDIINKRLDKINNLLNNNNPKQNIRL